MTTMSETVLTLSNGWSLRSDAGDNVRLCEPDGSERLYWDSNEWHEDPVGVMAAIFDAATSVVTTEQLAELREEMLAEGTEFSTCESCDSEIIRHPDGDWYHWVSGTRRGPGRGLDESGVTHAASPAVKSWTVVGTARQVGAIGAHERFVIEVDGIDSDDASDRVRQHMTDSDHEQVIIRTVAPTTNVKVMVAATPIEPMAPGVYIKDDKRMRVTPEGQIGDNSGTFAQFPTASEAVAYLENLGYQPAEHEENT